MKVPTAWAPSAKNFQVAAPVGYGSGVHIVFPQHFSDIPLFPRNETVLLCLCPNVSFKKNVRDASSEHDTTRQTTWHNSSSPDAAFCRNRPPKTPAETIPKPCVPLPSWQNLHHGSSAIAFSIPLLPPLSRVMDAGAEAGVEGVVFAARRAREVLVVEFTRLLSRSLTRRQRRRLRVHYRALLPELDLEFPCRCACALTRPRRSVKRPSFHRHQESDHVHGTTRCFTTSSQVHAATDTRNALHRRTHSAVARARYSLSVFFVVCFRWFLFFFKKKKNV